MHKKTLLSLALLTLLMSSYTINPTSETYVYMCKSKAAKKYHYNKACAGMNACSQQIIKMTLKDAKDKGKEPCSLEK
ncbi:hypothetical protein [Flavobacterium kingsejongi]|nr:hypothetical protein [Flavobacterium kingsejongi]